MENIRKGMERDKAMKESMQKLQEETAKVEKSKSFQAVRSGLETAKVSMSVLSHGLYLSNLQRLSSGSLKQVLLQHGERQQWKTNMKCLARL